MSDSVYRVTEVIGTSRMGGRRQRRMPSRRRVARSETSASPRPPGSMSRSRTERSRIIASFEHLVQVRGWRLEEAQSSPVLTAGPDPPSRDS